MTTEANSGFDRYIKYIRGDHDAARIELKPFMPRDYYSRHFDFQEYTLRDFSRSTWDLHYWLFESYKFQYGFFLPTSELMDRLVRILKSEISPAGRVLDAGSGSGFMSKELCSRGIEAFAVDCCDYENSSRKFGYQMIQVYQRDALGDAVRCVSSQFGAVLLIWPPYDKPFAFDIAQAMIAGQLLIFEGEDAGGCAADDQFFEYVNDAKYWTPLKNLSDDLNEVHVTFATQYDHWSIWRKLAK